MPNTIRCIKFGDILLDENRVPRLLCSNCSRDYGDLQRFLQHLPNCNTTKSSTVGIFDDNVSLVFRDSSSIDRNENLLGSYAKGKQKILVYKYNGVRRKSTDDETIAEKKNTNKRTYIDLVDVEQEVLDPRWYTDHKAKSKLTIGNNQNTNYKQLMNAIKPFVQFKENVEKAEELPESRVNGRAAAPRCSKRLAARQINSPQPSNSATSGVNIRNPTSRVCVQRLAADVYVKSERRKLPVARNLAQEVKSCKQGSPEINGLPRKPAEEPSAANSVPNEVIETSNRKSDTMEVTQGDTAESNGAPPSADNVRETEKIICKLQTMGLVVCRKNSMSQQQQPVPSSNAKKRNLELIEKLQSQGMDVKIIGAPRKPTTNEVNFPDPAKRLKIEATNNTNNVMTAYKTRLNKNLTIKRLKKS